MAGNVQCGLQRICFSFYQYMPTIETHQTGRQGKGKHVAIYHGSGALVVPS